LQASVNNIQRICGGVQVKQSYREIFLPDRTEQDTEEAEKIIASLKAKMNGGDKN
jgi:hypothetical protein